VVDWTVISSLATAGGTLVLALATFSAVRSSNRSARVAEEALLTGLRPLLIASRADDPDQKVLCSDQHVTRLGGGRAILEESPDGVIYLAMGLRNAGVGIALLHGWYPWPDSAFQEEPPPGADEFRRLTIDLYIAAGGTGYWEAAIRDANDAVRPALRGALRDRHPIGVDLLYGDQHGGQRTVSRFIILPAGDDGWFCQAGRHWNLDRPDPR
jgi:hypothetical protein